MAADMPDAVKVAREIFEKNRSRHLKGMTPLEWIELTVRAMQAAMAGREARVRKLEWVDRHANPMRPNDLVANSIVGRYAIRPSADGARFRLFTPGHDYNDAPEFNSIEAAKGAGKVHFDQTIRSALEPAGAQEGAALKPAEKPCVIPFGYSCEVCGGDELNCYGAAKHTTAPDVPGVVAETVAPTTELTTLIESLLAIKNPVPRIPHIARLLLKRSLARIAALQAEVEKLKGDLRVANAEVDDLQSECAGYENDDAKMEARAQTAEAERDAIKAEVERKDKALRECSDKLWLARCESQDAAFRAAAETACAMATAALAPAHKAGG